MMLLENNVALEAVEAIKKQLKAELVGKEIKKDSLEEKIKRELPLENPWIISYRTR